MLKIPRQQVLERWDTLPDNLKEALCSESNAGIVWQIGALNHLPEEKISIMATMVGDVIFGFLHPDDLTREIQESLNLNPQIANSISREINRKIFAPIRIALEKIYSPVSALPEIKPPVKPEAEIKIEKEIEPKPIPVEPPTETEPKPAPFPTIPTVPEAQKVPTAQREIPTAQPKVPAEPLKTVPITPVPAEKPFMIQQETESKPVGEKKRGAPPIIGWFRKEKPKAAPEKPIKVELETLGPKIEEKKEPLVAKTEAPKQKVIHYREVEIPTPFGKTQDEPFSKPFDKAQGEPKAQQPPKTETPTPAAIKTEQPPKPEEPKIISLDSFGVVKEKEVKLDGNTVNLKDNKPNP